LPNVEANIKSNDAHQFFAKSLIQDEGFEVGDIEVLRIAKVCTFCTHIYIYIFFLLNFFRFR